MGRVGNISTAGGTEIQEAMHIRRVGKSYEVQEAKQMGRAGKFSTSGDTKKSKKLCRWVELGRGPRSYVTLPPKIER